MVAAVRLLKGGCWLKAKAKEEEGRRVHSGAGVVEATVNSTHSAVSVLCSLQLRLPFPSCCSTGRRKEQRHTPQANSATKKNNGHDNTKEPRPPAKHGDIVLQC